MADDGLFLANRPLLLDIDGQVAAHLDQWLSREGMVECPPRASVDVRDEPYGDRYHAFPLPKPNYPPSPCIGINQLYWPTGAGRHARGYFLCTEADATYFRTAAYLSSATTSAGATVKKHVPLTLLARLGGKTLTAPMYMLAPRPLTSIVGSRLWLLPLVDARYWWTQIGVGSHPQRDPLLLEDALEDGGAMKAWTDVWTAIQAEIGTFTVSSFSDRFKPDPWEFTRQFENAAHMLDVAAMSCGLRVIREPGGGTYLLSSTDSVSRRTANWTDAHAVIAGDTWSPNPASERLQVMFQKLTEGAVDKREQWWRVDMAAKPYAADADITIIDEGDNLWENAADPNASFGVANCNEVIYTTFHANFDHTRPDPPESPTNQTDVAKLAREIYKRHYNYQLADGHDVTFAGIQPWRLNGFDDYLLFDFGSEGQPTTTIHAPPQHPGSENQSSPPTLMLERQRRITTRVRSMPQEFGIRHVLCQTDQFLRVQEHESFFKIIEFTPEGESESIKFLPPGGFAYAKAVWLDGTSWIEHGTMDLTVKLYDPLYYACGLIDEVLHATWSDERHRWEVDREHGLLREAKVYGGPIAAGSFGTCTICVEEVETSPPARISVHHKWIDEGIPLSVDTDITAVFMRDQKKWQRDNAECDE